MKPIIWLTGQPCSGKTTLAIELCKKLGSKHLAVSIDGDELRKVLGNPGYGEAGRRQNIKNAQNIAKFLQAKGFLPIVSLIAPYRDQRELLKTETTVLEVYCHTTEIRGKEHFFVKEYEPPEVNFLDMDTTSRSVESCVNEILEKIEKI